METPTTSTRTIGEIHRIEFSVDWPPGHVAAYLIDGPEPILVDAGMDGEDAQTELETGLADVDRSLEDIEHLVLTHPHIDHIGQIPALRGANDPTIYAPVGARKRLSRETADLEQAVRENAAAAGLKGQIIEEAIEKSVESLERNRTLLDPAVVDHWIDHGQEFTAGGLTLEAIHTPGHQADHCCYYGNMDGEPVLFSGDLLLEPFRSVIIHAGLDRGVEDGVSAFYTALERLDGLTVDHVFPGHGPAHQKFAENVERSRSSLDSMLADALENAQDEPISALDLAFTRAGEREIHYVLPEVVAALAYLESNGRATVTLDEGVKRYLAADE